MKKKNVFLLILLLILGPTLVLASTNTKSREGVENYGVTKFTIDDSKKEYVLKTPYVDENEKIYDFSEVLNDEEERKILEEIKEFKEKTTFDLVILTKDYPYYQDSENEDYACDFYDFNNFDKNGLLFFRNTYSKDPYYDLYSFGEAQLYFYDTRLSDILDDVYENIHRGEYYAGLHQLIENLYSYYESGKLDDYFIDKDGMLRDGNRYYEDENGEVLERPDYKERYDEYGNERVKINPRVLIFPALIPSLIITAIIISSMVSKNKMVRLATDASTYTNHDSINLTVNKDELVNSITNKTYIPPADSSSGHGRSGGGFSSHSSSIGHSGGGHSSGGGRHG